MDEHGVRQAVEELLDVDPDACDRSGLDHIVRLAQRVRGWVDAIDVRVARRTRTLNDTGTTEAAEIVLAGHGRRSPKDTRAAAQRSQLCDDLPGFETALATGAISTGHLDAVTTAARGLNDTARAALVDCAPDLLGFARFEPVTMFERRCRHLARHLSHDEGISQLQAQKAATTCRRWIDRHSGMYHTHLEQDPETGATLWTALDAEIAARKTATKDPAVSIDRLAVDALVDLVTGARSTTRRGPEVCVHIDHATLTSGLHPTSVCETADGSYLPPESIRRMACHGVIVPIVLDGEGEALDVGREQRLANRAQRRALRAMYRTCGHPDCQTPFDRCEIHHAIPWERAGPTDLANLIPLCALHHHLVHEGGWHLALGPHRVITLTRPDRTVYFHGPTIDRRAPLAASAAGLVSNDDPHVGTARRDRGRAGGGSERSGRSGRSGRPPPPDPVAA